MGLASTLKTFSLKWTIPLLDDLDITFLMDLVFEIPRLRHFVGRAERLVPLDQAVMEFDDRGIWISDRDASNCSKSPRIIYQI
jgi:hypothetical protein